MSGAKIAAVVAVAPLLAVASVLILLGGSADAYPAPDPTLCGGGGTAQTVAGIRLDAEQLGNAHTIVTVTAGRGLPAYGAVVAVTAAYTESGLHNSTAQTDHDSEGLFQQRVSVYGKPVADDPVRATNAFLDRLTTIPDWRTIPVGADAQTVQRSAYPGRYQPNATLAQQVVGQYWPTAAAAAAAAQPTAQPAASGPTPGPRTQPAHGAPTTRPTSHATATPSTPSSSASAAPAAAVSSAAAASTSVAVCAGAGGAAPPGSSGGAPARGGGGTGGTIAGTTTIPAGLTLTGTVQGDAAVRYALQQLGKPYVWGAAGPASFDCSGLTMAAWAAAGVPLPHLAAAQTTLGTAEPTDLTAAVSGDLVMIPGTDGTTANPGHVGMVAGYLDTSAGRRLYLIQAPETGVPVELTPASAWAGQVTDVRHIA